MTISRKQFVGVALLGCAFLIASNSLVFAHHGGEIEWKHDELLVVTAVATQLNLTFPHPLFYGKVTNKDGKTEPWAFLMRPTPTILRNHGWTRNSIKPGDILTITWSPHRTAVKVASVRRVLVNGKFLPIEPGDEACEKVTTLYRRCSDVQRSGQRQNTSPQPGTSD